MASSIVTSAVQQLGALVVGEAKYLYEVSAKIERLQQNLQWMQCFLEDADDRQHKDKVVAIWVADIRDFAYEAEEIVEKYLCEVSHHRENGMWNMIRWFSCVSSDALALHDVGSNIDCLRSRISELVSRMQMFGIQITGNSGNSTYDVAMREQRRTYAHMEEDPVGLEENIKEVVNKLVNNNEVKVVGISGMGGLGKTTLARRVFQNDVIRKHFKNNCVWVYISKQFERKDIYQEILIGLTYIGKDEEKTKKNEKIRDTVDGMKKIRELPDGYLPKEICEILKEKECLVVLDDIWRHGDWDFLKPAFEKIKSSGSKILITTRDSSLVQHIDKDGYPHTLNFLSEEDSWKLFRRVAFSESKNTENKETIGSKDSMRENPTTEEIVTGESSTLEVNNVDQTNLQDDDDVKTKKVILGREMLNHCNGLPLAIIALGGLLSTKKTITEWENVQRNITSYLISNLVEGSNSKELISVLELSFYDLPFYMKPCFMYLGIFPEDFEISTQRLYHLWEAEGLVTISVDGRDEIQGVSLYDVAESYLNQLVQRSMVQVEKRWPNGMIKSCRLHDLMRDLCLKKCKEVNFLNIIEHVSSDQDPSNQIVNTSTFGRKLRRCAIYLRGRDDISLNNYPYIRSLLVFPHGHNEARKLLSRNTQELLSLVRVLDLQGTNIRGLSMEIGAFIHLRYLSIKDALIDHLPSHIWDCKYLETLDLRCDFDFKLSNKFWKLGRLRHLYLPQSMELRGSKKLALKIGQLHQMETFKNFDVNNCNVEDLGEMRNVRVFSIGKMCFLGREGLEGLFKSPVITTKRLVNPLRLNIKAKVLNEDPTILTTKGSDLSNGGIRIDGRLEVALNDSVAQVLPRSLTRVALNNCEIGAEGIIVLEKLPRLKKLKLSNAIKESTLRFSNGGFTQLVLLCLWRLHTLEELEVEEGALPNLHYMQIFDCERLKMIPEGLPSSVQVDWQPCLKGTTENSEKYKMYLNSRS